jgi:hypothetical protein
VPSPFPPPDWLESALKKYKRSLGHVRLTPIIRAIETETRQNAAAAQGVLAFFDEKIKLILEAYAIFSDYHPSYLAYARELDRTQRQYVWMVDLVREHQILRDRWERRGLDPTILTLIDNTVITHKSV